MGLRLTCPACRQSSLVDDDRPGTPRRCPGCGQSLTATAAARASHRDDDGIWERRAPPRVSSARRSRRADDDEERPRRRSRSQGGSLQPLLWAAGGTMCLVLLLVAAGLFYVLLPEPGPAPVEQELVKLAPPPPLPVVPVNVPAAELPRDPPQLQALGHDLPAIHAAAPAEPLPNQLEPAALVRVKQATVSLRVVLPGGEGAEGSGFCAGAPGIVVTNAHVLGMLGSDGRPPQKIEVTLHSGEPDEVVLAGSVLGVDRRTDLAVVRVAADPARLPPPLPVGSCTSVLELQKVFIFGFPFGAKLGKNITASASSISALRKDEKGALRELQLNGGMHPGNSGGPIVDTRGVLVGVAVAGIRDAQINFAVPADFVQSLLDGRLWDATASMPFLDGDQRKLPLRLACLDPLRRIQALRLDVWLGDPGAPRPPSQQPPVPQAGDGPRLTYRVPYHDGTGSADVPLPPAEPGKVYWLQPVLLNAAGGPRWAGAASFAWSSPAALQRVPVTLTFRAPAGPVDRTLKLRSDLQLSLPRGAGEGAAFTDKMEADVLESLRPDPRGNGTAIRLSLGKCRFDAASGGKAFQRPAEADAALKRYSPTFLVDATHAFKERGQRDFRVLPPPIAEEVEEMYERLCSTYEAVTLALPNRPVQPQETWAVRLPLLILFDRKREPVDLLLNCTYEGVHTSGGRSEACLRLEGELKARNLRSVVGGKVQGHALFDVERGYITTARLAVSSALEVGDNNVLVALTKALTLTRSDGNPLRIVHATTNQPGAPGGPVAGAPGPFGPFGPFGGGPGMFPRPGRMPFPTGPKMGGPGLRPPFGPAPVPGPNPQ